MLKPKTDERVDFDDESDAIPIQVIDTKHATTTSTPNNTKSFSHIFCSICPCFFISANRAKVFLWCCKINKVFTVDDALKIFKPMARDQIRGYLDGIKAFKETNLRSGAKS